MAFDWDFVIGMFIIVFLILIIWARVTKQTVAEVFGDIRDILSGGKETAEDQVGEIIYE